MRINDLDIRERKVHLFEGEKNCMERVVYLSDDALFAIKLWLRRRDRNNEVTRRYARLTDTTCEEESFRAMAVIEKGGINGDY